MKLRFIKILVSVFLVFLFSLSQVSFALTPTEEREALEAELRELEEQIAKFETDITKTQKEKRTLQNQIYILRSKVKKLKISLCRDV